MVNWLQAKWQQISEFYGDSFVYNVKNMVGTGQGGSEESTKPKHAFRLWERASKARLQKICFNCWSSGRRNCKIHAVEEDFTDASKSMLMCQNWNLEDLERRYRSEEIQELVMDTLGADTTCPDTVMAD